MKTTIKNRKNKFIPTSNPFVKAMQNVSNVGITENGAVTNKSTLNYVLDFFGAAGAIRSRSEQDVINLFSKAFSEDRLVTMKILFYIRDREGQGERKTFRICMKYLAENYPDVFIKNIENIPFYGRWDDLYCIFGKI